MPISTAVEKLKISNEGLNVIRDNIHEQLGDLRSDPRMEGLVDDLEALFETYLATWIKSNTEILDILENKK